MAIALAYVTFPDEGTAKSMARNLVEAKLAACTNIFHIASVYEWEGKVEDSEEFVALFKTSPESYDEMAAAIEAAHPYDVPCIMRLDVTANAAYEAWVRS